MITLDQLCGVLDGLGIPWANEGFSDDDKPAPPYMSLEAGFGETAYADNAAWGALDALRNLALHRAALI